MNIQFENKEICKKCGLCCKKCGCDYSAYDFEDLSYNYLYKLLLEGNISIVSSFIKTTKTSDNNLHVTPFLYLRARNKNRPIIDLLSMKTACMHLKSDGCSYDLKNRPSGGVNLIPKENMQCYPLKNPLEIVKTWEQYQKVLRHLVKKISGYNVEDRLRLDVENLIYDLLSNNTEGVTKMELKDILSLLPLLINSFPDEVAKGQERYDKSIPKIKVKTK